MCGIMGYHCFSNARPDKNKITDMFTLLETRGRDASGFAFIRDNNLIVHKAPVKSSDLVKTDDWRSLKLPKIMILHTRMKTQGTEKNNNNNHPLYSKSGMAIVHNGIIHNDKEIFGKKQRDGEVDSESILHLLSTKHKGDKIKRLFDRLEGSFAVAVIDRNQPDKLFLVRRDNPIDLYFNSEDEILYFCSERQIMQNALGIKQESKRGFNLGEHDYHFYEMENNHALVINKDGVESYQKYSPRYSDWWDRQFYSSRINGSMLIECPWCFCQTRYNETALHNRCSECGMDIAEEDLLNV